MVNFIVIMQNLMHPKNYLGRSWFSAIRKFSLKKIINRFFPYCFDSIVVKLFHSSYNKHNTQKRIHVQ